MKTTTIKKSALALMACILALAFALVGCGGSKADPEEAFLGSWKLSGGEIYGEELDDETIKTMEEVMNEILIREVETKNIMTKSSLPVGGYSVNPYVGCTHACKYCYASFMKRFTGHTEEWGTFLDVKHWPEIKNPKKYAGQRVVIGSVTDGYNPQEEQFGNTRKLLEQLIGSDADILICTKSDLVVRDIDLLKKLGRVTVSWSINTLDENFKNDMDSASSIEHRIAAMKQVYEAGIRTVCFVSPVFPGTCINLIPC